MNLSNFFENVVYERYSGELALYQLSKSPCPQIGYPLIYVVTEAGRRDEVSQAQWAGQRDGDCAVGLRGPVLSRGRGQSMGQETKTYRKH